MKKWLWILAGILLFLGIGGLVGYFFRQQQAEQQLVAPTSETLLTIAIDDLLLDNLDQLFARTKHSPQDTSNVFQLRDCWDAGLGIPAKVYFFSLVEQPGKFYSLQRLRDAHKWQAFWASHAPASTKIKALADEEHVLFRFSLKADEELADMEQLLAEKAKWIKVADLNRGKSSKKAHLHYQQLTGDLDLFADIADQEITLSGNWKLAQEAAKLDSILIRESPYDDATFLSFWNTLPLALTPGLSKALAQFSAVDSELLQANSHNYLDLFIGQKSTMQQDTILSYDYDEDFNTVEKQEIQQNEVPQLQSAWKGSAQLPSLLPTTLFYQLHPFNFADLTVLSTSTTKPASPKWILADSPLQLSIAFEQLPESWTGGILRTLQQKKVKLSLNGNIMNKNTLHIQGKVSYLD